MTTTNDDPVSERRDTSSLRRELDRQYVMRLQRLEDRLDSLEKQATNQAHTHETKFDNFIYCMDKRFGHLDALVNDVRKVQYEQQPSLETLDRIVQSGVTLRWMITAAVALLATIAAVATSMDTLQKWMNK